MTKQRHMCIRILEDGERERATHFAVVDANDYDEATANIEQLRTENEALKKAGDILAHQFSFKLHADLLAPWWAARGGQEQCSVCHAVEPEPKT